MLILLVAVLWCLLGVQGETVPVVTTMQSFQQGEYKYHKPDNTAACALPYFVHITIVVPENFLNATLVSIFWGRIFGSVIPIYYPESGTTNVGATGIANAYKKGSPLPSPYWKRPRPDFGSGFGNGIYDANYVLICDMLEFTMTGLVSQITLIAISLSNWAPWNAYVPIWIRSLQWWIWDYADTQGGPINSIPVAITSTPPCIFAGAVSADGKTLRMWVIHCVHSFFNGDIQYNKNIGEVLPTQVPASFIFDMLTIHIPYPWLSPNPCYPEIMVNFQVTFYKWVGLIAQNPGNANAAKYINSYMQFGPIAADITFSTTSIEMHISAMIFITIYPGNNEVGIIANTIQDTDLQVITVIFVPGAQLQGGNAISIVLSIGALSIFNQPWNVARGIILADVLVTNTAAAYIMIGPKGTCAAFSGSVNCCAQSIGSIMVPWPSYMSYPSWFISFIIKLNPAGCVLPAGKVVAFIISKIYLGRNPKTTVPLGFDRNHLDANNAVVAYPVTSIWQVLVFLASTAEPQGVLMGNFLELWPLGWVQIIPGFEQVGVPVPMSSWDIVISGGVGCWVIGTGIVLSVRLVVNSNVAMIQPTTLTVTITLRTGLAVVADSNTPIVFQLSTFPSVLRANVGSVAQPLPLTGSSPAACANALTYFTSSWNTLFVSTRNKECMNTWGANAVIVFVLPTDALLPNPAAGWTVYFYFRIINSHRQGFKWDGQNGAINSQFPGGVILIGTSYPDGAALMWQQAYTIVADCRNIPYQPGAVTDVVTSTLASRCTLVNALSYISPVSTGFLTCNVGATTATAQSLTTYIKYVEGTWHSTMWPWMNDAQRGSWPQQVNLPGTIPIYIYTLGYMFSTPMFAIVVTYPATKTNLNSLGVAVSVPTNYILAFIVRLDRLTSACSVNTVEENPWIFCAAITTNVVQVLHFPSAPVITTGVQLNQYSSYYGWTKNSYGICAIVRSDGAVAGWYVTGSSPQPDGGSDAAWYAFFAFFALPLLLLLCCLAWALWYFRKPKECCPCVPEYPVQEMYWVNAQPACPAPVYMVEPAISAPVTCPPTTPIYLVQ